MADRNTVRKGYSYREEPTDTKVDLAQPEQIAQTQGGISTQGPRDLRDARSGAGYAIGRALVQVADQELAVLKKDADRQQAAEGYIRAGNEEALSSIKKRQSAMDWVFGTRAKGAQAAAVQASVQVTNWTAQSLLEMDGDQQEDPEAYQNRKLKEVTNASEQISDPDLRTSFLDMASQRLGKLVAIQRDSNHEFVQNKARQDYKSDLKGRLSLLQEMEARGGLSYELAKEELYTLFSTKPEGMTEKAHLTAIAEAIMEEAGEGSRDLYNFAKGQGIIDDMPEDIRTKLEADYKRKAPINDPKYITADENYRKAMLDPTISPAQFEQLQLDHIAKWDMVHSYSDEQLAQHRIRHQKALEAAQGDTDNLNADTAAYARGDNAYLETVSKSRQRKAADNFFQQQFAARFLSGDPERRSAFMELPPEQRNSEMYGALTQAYWSGGPAAQEAQDFLTSAANHAATVGTSITSIKGMMESGLETVIMDGDVHPNTLASYAMASGFLSANQGQFLTGLLDNEALAKVMQYDNLVGNGLSPKEALMYVASREGQDLQTRGITKEKEVKAFKESYTQFEDLINERSWWNVGPFKKGPDIINVDDIQESMQTTARSIMAMNPTMELKAAYKAAARMEAENREIVGNVAVNKGEPRPMSALVGFDEATFGQLNMNEVLSEVYTLENAEMPTKRGELNWDKVNVSVNMASGLIHISPIEDDDGYETVTGGVTLTFQQIVSKYRNILGM